MEVDNLYPLPVTNMPRRKGTGAKVLERRGKVARLMVQGKRPSEIAALLGMEGQAGRVLVSQDTKIIKDTWKASAAQDLGELRAREKAVLEYVRAEACAAWERSQRPAEGVSVVTKKVRVEGAEPVNDYESVPAAGAGGLVEESRTETVRRDGQVGTPAFLNLILAATQEIEDLMGLKAKPGEGGTAPPLLGIRLFAPGASPAVPAGAGTATG